MARIRLDHIRHAYSPALAKAGTYALREVDHAFEDGGAYALLGPSGCGKTTLLNIISGLLTPSEGKVRFDDRDVTMLTPEARNIAQVFQFPVIYDTMTVRENLAFPLKNRKLPKAEIQTRVSDMIRRIGLEAKADRKARGLTADEKQKISLGRGLVRSDVNAILFDEPLTVIDPHMKWQLRSELKQLHHEFAMTMIYVTHDQTEALTFADKVVVMYDGEVVQIGTPEELFERPRHTFVGYFIGSPGMNVLPCRLEAGEAVIADARIALAGLAPVSAGQKTELGIRPEFVEIVPSGDGIPVSVTKVEDVGSERIVRATLSGNPISAIVPEGASIPADAAVRFAPHALNVYADSWLVERA
ncbi:ABC transporter ATP-binding protein [Aurantimonas endophytica]|uniref:Glycerol transport system ATP-binding protein n=1 Tax=Aurantimonas endophytica TaxID=1522175 RepID=A0A7W6HFQ8_9HYPH|nr:ABC transporter ATP-binding protein [Aurantimonas endophytica]MBB4004331.1 glycerol transport system ATP-binding protein [Aurantimonas endophytica]MCO6405171.1 ATP-binding cassette domain-containing protein [Aurantimonas endophytica]